MSEARVSVEFSDHVARVTLTRPEKHNALNFPMLDALTAAAEQVRSTAGVRAVVLAGAGKSFSSGLDFPAVTAAGGGPQALLDNLQAPVPNRFQQPVYGWLDQPTPVIAAIHGNCLGGGLQLALAADIRIATPDARLGLLESKWGLVPDMAITRTLPRLVGIDVAKELIFTGRIVDGTKAHSLGLVTQLAADPLAAALELAHELATRSPHAVRAAKQLLDQTWLQDDAKLTLGAEADAQAKLIGTPNQLTALQAGLTGQVAGFVDPT